MGFSLDMSVPAMTVFFQGLLSFFSPCVLPLLPLYIGYLSGGTGVRGEDGKIHYPQSKVAFHTVCFVIGVSFAFYLLGLGVSAAATFFNSSQMLFARAGGILVMLFGLYQLGVFGSSQVLGKEHRLPFRMDAMAMSPWTALLMGFTFSFAWTPCVGPALTGVLLMAASATSKATGFVLIGVYTLGFVLPFLAMGFFTASLLDFFKKYRGVVQYTVKIGGVLLVLMGFMMFTGKMNDVTGYLSGMSGDALEQEKKEDGKSSISGEEGKEERENSALGGKGKEDEGNSVSAEDGKEESNRSDAEYADSESDGSQPAENSLPPAIDFQLSDQYGNVHTLEDYKGKTIFLNFWATWCPPCRAEMPDIQKLYETYSQEGEEALIVLGVAAPLMGQEKTQEEIEAFLEENGYTYPVLMDTSGDLFYSYGIRSFPTTFMIDRDGNVFGYISGQLNMDRMESIIRQTMEGKRNE